MNAAERHIAHCVRLGMAQDCLLPQCLSNTGSHGTQAGRKTYFVDEEDLELLIFMSLLPAG